MNEAASLSPPLATGSEGARVIGVSFLAQFMVSGLTTYVIGVFLKPVTSELGISRTALSLAMPILAASTALLLPLVGRLVDARPVRPIMVAGALLLGGSLASLSRIESGGQGGLLIVALAAGAALGGSLPASALVVRAFERDPRRALGLASVGTSAGGFLMPVIASALIVRADWREALLLLGGVSAVLLASSAGLGIPANSDRPPRPDAGRPFEWQGAMRAWNFWLITGYMTLIYGTNQALIFHLPAFANDAGIPFERAAWLASVLALFSLLGKLVYSAVGNRFDVRAPLWIAGALQAPALLLLIVSPTYPVMLVMAAVNGLGTGAVLPAWSALVARCFDPPSFGRVLGLTRLVAHPLMSISPVLAAWIHGSTGSYQLAFQGFLVAALVVAWLPLLIRVPGRV
jgi:MFS family permease